MLVSLTFLLHTCQHSSILWQAQLTAEVVVCCMAPHVFMLQTPMRRRLSEQGLKAAIV